MAMFGDSGVLGEEHDVCFIPLLKKLDSSLLFIFFSLPKGIWGKETKVRQQSTFILCSFFIIPSGLVFLSIGYLKPDWKLGSVQPGGREATQDLFLFPLS